MLKSMNTELNILNKKCDLNRNQNITKFYEQVIKSWYELFNFIPNSPNEILNEYVLHNKSIKIGTKVIDKKYINSPNLKIIDITEKNGFKTLIQLNSILENNITQMKYNSIISAIPILWKKTIKNISDEDQLNIAIMNDEPHLKINSKLKPLSKCNNKNIYLSLLIKNIKPPTATDTWINIFPFLEKKIGRPFIQEHLKLQRNPIYKVLNSK